MNTRAHTLAIPYALARVPLTVLDRVLVQQLPAGCRTRTVFDHGLGTADHWMGLVLHDVGIVDSGRARIDRAGHFSGRGVDAVAPPRRLSRQRYADIRPVATPSR